MRNKHVFKRNYKYKMLYLKGVDIVVYVGIVKHFCGNCKVK